MSGLLFVTAPEADHKIINRLLLHLHDWEYESGDNFKLITTRSIESLRKAPTEPVGVTAQFKPTEAPVDVDLRNAWAGATLEEVEAFCLALDKEEDFQSADTHLFVVLDADGLKDKTCVFGERVIDWDSDPLVYPEEFNRARVPWYQVYLSWCNLHISNIGWDEMMMEDDAEDVEDRWWTYNTSDSGEYLSQKNKKKRDDAISELRREGRA